MSGAPIERYYVYWGADVNGTSTTSRTQLDYTPTALTADGDYYMRIQVKDQAGNLSAWTTVFIYRYFATQVTKYYGLGPVTAMSREGAYCMSPNRGLEGRSGALRVISDQVSSTALVVDADGDMVPETRYYPFGEVRYTSGNSPTDKTYTGQRSEDFGLMDYNARYYSPYLNQFIQPDTIVPDYTYPQTLNLYSYVLNNPIIFTDPSGLVPFLPPGSEQTDRNDRDLTWWLYKELTTNVNSYYVQRIKTLLGGSFEDIENASKGWIYLVKDAAKWDFKDSIKREMLGEAITFFDNNNGFRWYEYSVPGNIFYGYIGSAAGFPGSILHGGASFAEITDPAHFPKDNSGNTCCPCPEIDQIQGIVCQLIGCGYYNPLWIKTGFDDPTDFNAVQLGIDLYKDYREGLTFSQLIDVLTKNGDKLARTKYVPSRHWINMRGGWPYDVERFNGPDDEINEPKVLEFLQ